MSPGNIAEAIASLTPEQQESVILFVEFLKHKGAAPSSGSSLFLDAVEEFINQHPELLHNLAQ
jgi:hypothetical protein